MAEPSTFAITPVDPGVTVLHVKRAASRGSARARYEFERAMWLFYRKHYRATTPGWVDTLVKLGLGLRGGSRLRAEMRAPDGAAR